MDKHIDEITLRQFATDSLAEQEQLSILEHIAQCEQCAMKYSEIMEEKLIKAPISMKNSIMEQKDAIQQADNKKYFVFYRYCTKVGIGMVASLLLLFGNPSISNMIDYFPKKTQIESVKFRNSVQKKLKEIESQFVFKEDFL
ncbi:MAG: hypothetical protein KH355_12885 [Clostridiales bacterium]|nr:hypothetical protein [Clostridiales bacterium]